MNSSSTLPPSEPLQAVPAAWNNTFVPYPKDVCLHQLIAEQAQRTPAAIALEFEGRTLTFRELDERSNQLARIIQRMGAGPEVLVGISAYRSIELVVGLVAIIKAGAAYVPIDPEYPADRISYMLGDSGVSILLTQDAVACQLPAHQATAFCMDSRWSEIEAGNPQPLPLNTHAQNLAYMIYTSGSTGRPKGALNTHRGICNRLLWMQDQYKMTPADTVLQKTPFSFDVSVWEFFWPLLVGARLVVARPGGHQDPAYLSRIIQEQRVTVIHFVPSMLRAFLAEPTASQCTSLRHVICSGEALTYDLQEKFFSRLPCELHNLYGPTEAAVDVTHWTCQRNSSSPVVPIGRPVANTQIHILDDALRPVAPGAEGELHIGGVQVGRGYHNRPDLSAQKFIPDPLSTEPGARLYKTGDLARWTPDGVVEYLGRLDFQVKIRGFRIELGEIESVLAQHPTVRQAVVIAHVQPGQESRLAAYLSERNGQRATVTDLREHLLARLPDYMVPASFTWLDTIPLSPNGKVDRKALPEPSRARPQLRQAYVAPGTELEREIARIWQDILQIDQVGLDDRFLELGGDSLGLTRIHAVLQTHLTREFPITDLFQHTTVRELARHLSGTTNAANPAVNDRARLQREAMARQKRDRPTR